MMPDLHNELPTESRGIVDQYFEACATAAHLPSPEAYAECFELRLRPLHKSDPQVADGAVSVLVDIRVQSALTWWCSDG